MSYRIFGYLPFLAAALGVPAAAQAGSAACTGDGIMADNGAERGTTIIRSGSGHTATVTRTDPDGTIHTIEGNSSNMVARRTHDAGAVGYVRLG